MKDIFEIYDENGRTIKMELICSFKLNNYKHYYIVYSDLKKEHYYLSKYSDSDNTTLIKEFDKNEYNQALTVFMEVQNGIRN